MAKQLTFSNDAQYALKRGVDTLANAVGTTLGPKGRNVALDKKFGAPTVEFRRVLFRSRPCSPSPSCTKV